MSQTRPTPLQLHIYSKAWVHENNMTAAWLLTFVKSKASKSIAHHKASRFHKLAEVQDSIKTYTETLKKRIREQYATSAEGVVEALHKNACIGSKLISNGNDEEVPINLAASNGAYAQISKMAGYDAPDRLDITSDGKPIRNEFNIYPVMALEAKPLEALEGSAEEVKEGVSAPPRLLSND